MIQTVISFGIIALAVIAAIVYFVRLATQLSRKQSVCNCCDKKNSCQEWKNLSKKA